MKWCNNTRNDSEKKISEIYEIKGAVAEKMVRATRIKTLTWTLAILSKKCKIVPAFKKSWTHKTRRIAFLGRKYFN